MHAAFRKSGALRKAPDALLPMFTNRVENANTFGPQSHRVGPCSEGWLKSWRKSALQSTRSTTGCPALGEYSDHRCPGPCVCGEHTAAPVVPGAELARARHRRRDGGGDG